MPRSSFQMSDAAMRRYRSRFSGAKSFATVVLFAAASALAQTPSTKFDQKSVDYRLMTDSVPGISMATYGLIGTEMGPPRTEASGDRDAFEKLVRGAYANQIAGDKAPQAAPAAAAFTNSAWRLAIETEDRVREVEDFKLRRQAIAATVNGSLSIAAEAVPDPRGKFGVVAVQAVSGIAGVYMDAASDRALADIRAEQSRSAGDLATYALYKTRKENAELFKSIEKDSKDPKTVQRALASLVGAQKEFFEPNFLDLLPDESARASAISVMVGSLGDALGRLKLMTDAKFKALESEIDNTKSRLTRIEVSLDEFRDETGKKLKVLGEATAKLQESVADLSKSVKTIEASGNQNSHDIALMQQFMYGKLTPKEQLKALEQGFLRDLPLKKREELLEKATREDMAAEFSSTVGTGIAAVEGFASLAVALGMPVDTKNLQKNINTAKAATVVISALIRQNYFSAVFAAGGLLGGGGADGPDIGASRHAELLGKLNEVLEMQKELRKAVGALSAQVAQSTDRILFRIAELEYKQDLTNKILRSGVYGDLQEACVAFQADARNYYGLSDDGTFPSYDVRAEHFDVDQWRGKFYTKCREFLDTTVLRLSPSKGTHVTLHYNVNTSKESSNWQDTHWKPMWDYTQYVLELTNRPNCGSRLLGRLSQTNWSLVAWEKAGPVDCRDSQADVTSSVAGIYRNFARQVISGSAGFDDAIYFPSVRFLGEAAAFMAPYSDLVMRNWGAERRLMTKAELGKATALKAPPEGAQWMSQLIDLINVAIAQQGLYGGTAVVSRVAETVIRAQVFGDTPSDMQMVPWVARWKEVEAGGRVPKVNADGQTTGEMLDDGGLRKWWYAHPSNASQFVRSGWNGKPTLNCSKLNSTGTVVPDSFYFATLCLANINPFFRDNLTTYFVLKALEASGSAMAHYRTLLNLPNREFARNRLPGLPIEWRAVDGYFGWALRLRGATGEREYWPLPPAYVVENALMSYPPAMVDALAYRQRVATRFVYYSAVNEMSNDKTLKAGEKMDAIRLSQRSAVYNDDVRRIDLLVERQ